MIWSTGIKWKKCVHTTPEKFDNAASLLRLDLPSSVLRHEDRAFRKRSSNRRNLKTPTLLSSVDGNILKSCNFPDRVFLTQKSKLNADYSFFKFLCVVWTENTSCVFRVKTLCSNFLQPSVNGASIELSYRDFQIGLLLSYKELQSNVLI